MSEETIDQATLVDSIIEKSLTKNSDYISTFSQNSSSNLSLPQNLTMSENFVPCGQIESNYSVEDNRVRITGEQIKSWPYCCIGLVTATLNGQQVYATGVLVDSRVVLTCAGVVFNTEEATNVRFFPAFDGTNYTKSASVQKLFVPEEFRNSKDEEFNYSLLLLEESLEEYGYMGISFLDVRQTNDYFNICGYPQDKVQGKENTYEMWGCKQKISLDDAVPSVNHFYPTSGLQGAPVFAIYPGTNNCILYGLFTSCNVNFERKMSSVVKNMRSLLGKEIHFINAYNEELNDEGFKLLLQRNLKFEELLGFSLNCENISFETFTLIKNVNLSNLRWLTLNNNNYGDQGFEFLCGCSFFRNLGIINLDKNLSGKSLELLTSFEFPQVEDLTIQAKLTTDDWKLLQNIKMPNLSKLSLCKSDLTDNDLEFIAQVNFKNLLELDLGSNQITGSGLSHFIGKSFDNLKKIDLSCNPIDDAGLEIISKLSMPVLRVLDLMKTENKTKSGIEHLLNMNFPILEYIELYPHTKRAAFLKEKFPKLQVGGCMGDEDEEE